MDIKSLVYLQITIFTLMMIGVIVRKTNILTESGKKSLTDVFIDVVLPCNIIHSFQIEMSMEIIVSSAWIMVIAIGVQVLAMVINATCYRRVSSDKKVVFKYGTICSNAGLIGNSICENIYGPEGLLYASIYLIPQRLCMWSVGLAYFETVSGKKVIKKLCTHPCIIAVLIGFLVLVFQIHFPQPFENALNYVSNCNLPLSMILVGSILAEVNAKSVVNKYTMYYCLMRLLIIPCIILGICMCLPVNSTVIGVSTALAGMPSGTTTAILAEKYDKDAKFASACVFTSTLLSLVTIPVLYLIIAGITA